MLTDEMIAELEEQGFLIVRPRQPDEELRANWNQILSVLRMSEDLVHGGARLTVRHAAWLGEGADAVKLLRDGIVRRIDAVLSTAVVKREERADVAD